MVYEVLVYATFFIFFFLFTISHFFYPFINLVTWGLSGHAVQENFSVSLALREVFGNLCASSKQQHNRWVSWSQ